MMADSWGFWFELWPVALESSLGMSLNASSPDHADACCLAGGTGGGGGLVDGGARGAPGGEQRVRVRGGAVEGQMWSDFVNACPSAAIAPCSASACKRCPGFSSDPQGNGLINLAYQLISAKINMLLPAPNTPTVPKVVEDAIAAADKLIGSKVSQQRGRLPAGLRMRAPHAGKPDRPVGWLQPGWLAATLSPPDLRPPSAPATGSPAVSAAGACAAVFCHALLSALARPRVHAGHPRCVGAHPRHIVPGQHSHLLQPGGGVCTGRGTLQALPTAGRGQCGRSLRGIPGSQGSCFRKCSK